MDAIHFLSADDSQELIAALQAEGYRVAAARGPRAAARSRWLLEVEPFDDGVVAMVDVYGGWLPDEARLTLAARSREPSGSGQRKSMSVVAGSSSGWPSPLRASRTAFGRRGQVRAVLGLVDQARAAGRRRGSSG